jgi:hypothetical protein
MSQPAPTRLQIVPAELAHVYRLAPDMRAPDCTMAEILGRSPKAALRQSFKNSPFYRRSVLRGDTVLAMWGLTADVLGDQGMPWLATSRHAVPLRLRLIRLAQLEVAEMLRRKPILVDFHLARDGVGCRFLALLGFAAVGEPLPSRAGAMQRYELRRD